MNKLNKKGFTLIEMLVVIAIIAVLVSIIVPVVGNSTKKAAAATNAANLRSAAATLAIEVMENKHGALEDGASLEPKTFDAPTVKNNGGLGGDAFAAVYKDGTVVCTFGEGFTIDYYADIAAGGDGTGNAGK